MSWLITKLGGLLLMMGQHARSESLFYYFRLEDQVPENHLLRMIDRHISFQFVREKLRESYSAIGRPSIDPEVLLRILVIGYLYGVTSERKLVEELRMHLAWRWFTGLGFEQEIPHHSTFSKNRHGRFQTLRTLRWNMKHQRPNDRACDHTSSRITKKYTRTNANAISAKNIASTARSGIVFIHPRNLCRCSKSVRARVRRPSGTGERQSRGPQLSSPLLSILNLLPWSIDRNVGIFTTVSHMRSQRARAHLPLLAPLRVSSV
jgi:transposase